MDGIEYEQEEKKFRLTRGMLILGILIFLAIIVVIGIIIHSINSKKPEYTLADFKRLEQRMLEEAPNYLNQKQIELNSEEAKIDLSNFLDKNGGGINSNIIKAAKVCDGYVLASKKDKEEYNAYIKCGNMYTTPGYKEEAQNKTTTTTAKDTEKPVITIIGDSKTSVFVNSSYNDAGAVANDNIDGDITSKIEKSGNVDISNVGEYIITYVVSDKAGNRSEAKRTVNVVPAPEVTTRSYETVTRRQTTRVVIRTTKKVTTPPVIVLSGKKSITINLGEDYKDPGYVAKDSMGNDLTSNVNVSSNVNKNAAGNYSVTYTVVDSYGNKAVATRNVIVKSNIIYITGISLSPNSVELRVGQTKALTVYYSPSNATNKNISWSSNNTSVAMVSAGVVTARKKGIALITARTDNGKTAQARIEVK